MGDKKRRWWQPSTDYEPKEESGELRRARLAREPVVEELRRWRRRVAALSFAALMFAGLFLAAPAWLRTDPSESSMTEFLHELVEVHRALAPDEMLVGFAGLALSSVLVLLLPSAPWGSSPSPSPRQEMVVEVVRWTLFVALNAVAVLAVLSLSVSVATDRGLVSATILGAALVFAGLMGPEGTERQLRLASARNRRERAEDLIDVLKGKTQGMRFSESGLRAALCFYLLIALACACMPAVLGSVVGALHGAWSLVGLGVALSLVCGVMAVYALYAWGLQRLPSDVRESRFEFLPFIFPPVSTLLLVFVVGVSALLDREPWYFVAVVFVSGLGPLGVALGLNRTTVHMLIDLRLLRTAAATAESQERYLAESSEETSKGLG